MAKQPTGAAAAPDNNKRLALLEAGVSALTMALVANGVTVPEGGDVHAIAIATIKSGAKAHAEAIEQISAMGAKVAALEAAGTEEAKAELVQLRAKVAELETEVAELETDVTDAVSEKNRLANLLAEAGTSPPPPAVDQETAAAPEPVERERPETARDVGPEFGTLSADEIAQAIAEEVGFEIAFSNGAFEIVDFSSPAIVVAPGELERVNAAQFAVGPAVQIRGGAAAEEIHGAGLLIEGVQVGYCRFDPAIRMEPGQERKFHRALIFG